MSLGSARWNANTASAPSRSSRSAAASSAPAPTASTPRPRSTGSCRPRRWTAGPVRFHPDRTITESRGGVNRDRRGSADDLLPGVPRRRGARRAQARVGGWRVYVMAGGRERHDLMCGFLFTALAPGALRRGCRPFQQNRKIRLGEVAYIPDIVIVGPNGFGPDRQYERDLSIVIEVLSPAPRRPTGARRRPFTPTPRPWSCTCWSTRTDGASRSLPKTTTTCTGRSTAPATSCRRST